MQLENQPKKSKEIIVRKNHDENCYYQGRQKSLCPDFKKPIFWGGSTGLEGKKSTWIWYRVICNSPDCNFLAVVKFDVLENNICNL